MCGKVCWFELLLKLKREEHMKFNIRSFAAFTFATITDPYKVLLKLDLNQFIERVETLKML